MGNSRLKLAINGLIMIFLGITFCAFPEFFTLSMFPDIEKNNEAFNVANALRKNMGAGCFFIGLLIFWCQNSPKFVAQKTSFLLWIWFFNTYWCFIRSKIFRSGSSTCIYFNIVYNYGINFYLYCIKTFSKINIMALIE